MVLVVDRVVDVRVAVVSVTVEVCDVVLVGVVVVVIVVVDGRHAVQSAHVDHVHFIAHSTLTLDSHPFKHVTGTRLSASAVVVRRRRITVVVVGNGAKVDVDVVVGGKVENGSVVVVVFVVDV